MTPADPPAKTESVLKTPLPVFDLAPLTEFPPETFISDDADLDAFVLMLSLVYNDLKGFEWTNSMLRRAEPEGPTGHILDPQLGQLIGMKVWAVRFTVALLHELLDAIKQASSDGITGRPRFQKALASLVPEAAKAWISLERLANEQYDATESVRLKAARKWFIKVRSNITHHYYQPKPLRDAYKSFFVDSPRVPANSAAFASLGRTMEKTRFFYADAAALEYYQEGGEDSHKHSIELRQLATGALLVAIHAYLNLRRRELSGESI